MRIRTEEEHDSAVMLCDATNKKNCLEHSITRLLKHIFIWIFLGFHMLTLIWIVFLGFVLWLGGEGG